MSFSRWQPQTSPCSLHGRPLSPHLPLQVRTESVPRHAGCLPNAKCAARFSLIPLNRLAISYAADRWFIEHRPEETELLDRINHLLEIDRLHDVSIGSQLITFHKVLLFARGREHDNGHHLHLFVRLDLPE